MTLRSFEWRGAWILGAALFALHCGSDEATSDSAPDEAGSAGNGGNGTVAEPSDDEIPTLNGCAPSDYEDHSVGDDRRVVAIAANGLVFTPKCLLVARGQTVQFEGSLTSHPLAPGNPSDPNAGSSNNPIVKTSTGKSVSFDFSSAGTFPYYCELHAFGEGSGMAGAIHVR